MKTFQNQITVLSFCFFVLSSIATNADSHLNFTVAALGNCPTASFSILNNGIDAGTPLHFRNESTGGATYLWEFGDGTTSTAEHPSHTYNASGNYTVKLTVIENGCTVSFIGIEEAIVN